MDSSNILLSRARKAAAMQLVQRGPEKGRAWEVSTLLRSLSELRLPTLEGSELRTQVVLLMRMDMWWRSSDFTVAFRERILWENPGDPESSGWATLDLFRPKEWHQGQRDWTQFVTLHRPSLPWTRSSIDTLEVLTKYLNDTSDLAKTVERTRIGDCWYTPYSSHSTSNHGAVS